MHTKNTILIYNCSIKISKMITQLKNKLLLNTVSIKSEKLLKKYLIDHPTTTCILFQINHLNSDLELIKQLRCISFYPEIILINDNMFPEDIKSFVEYGVFYIFEPPYTSAELKILLQQVLKKNNCIEKLKLLIQVSLDPTYYDSYISTLEKINKNPIETLPLHIHDLEKKKKEKKIKKQKNTIDQKSMILSNKNLLIVEDDRSLLDRLKKWLSLHFDCIYVAQCGKDALNIILNQQIDLALIDLGLSDDTGEVLLQKIKHINCCKIVLTAFKDNDLMLSCFEKGAHEYITKPFQMSHTLAKIKHTIYSYNEKKDSLTL